MKVLAAILIVTALWVVLGAVLGGCAGRRAAGDRPAGQPWVWQTLEGPDPLIGAGRLPASHPLARLDRSPSRPA
jgi:hypothetical protein